MEEEEFKKAWDNSFRGNVDEEEGPAAGAFRRAQIDIIVERYVLLGGALSTYNFKKPLVQPLRGQVQDYLSNAGRQLRILNTKQLRAREGRDVADTYERFGKIQANQYAPSDAAALNAIRKQLEKRARAPQEELEPRVDNDSARGRGAGNRFGRRGRGRR